MPTHQVPQEFQGGQLVSTPGNNRFQHLAFMIYCMPEVTPIAADLHGHLVDVPSPIREYPHPIDAPAPDLGREHWAKSTPSKPNRLVTDIDPTPVQRVLNTRSDNGKRTYSITARRMISGFILN